MVAKINKRGQLTMFIILGLLLAGIIIVAFLLMNRPSTQKTEGTNPEVSVDSCVTESITNSINKVLVGGGLIDPVLFKLYQSEKYNYLCYQKNYYLTCVTQYPQLKTIVENQIFEDSNENIRACFSNLKSSLQEKNFVVTEGDLDWHVEIVQDKVLIKIQKNIKISKENSAQEFNNFDSYVSSNLYGLVETARTISNQEAQYCNFEYNGFVLLYPQYKIKRIDYDDSKLYIVSDRNTQENFKFAIRGCAFPPGI